MSPRLPFNKRTRHRWTQNGYGHRPVNNWGDGDLPAPWAEGDIVELVDESLAGGRLRGQVGPMFVVSYATSVDEGDAWYFRVYDGAGDRGSDRLHVATPASTYLVCDYMAGFRLVDTADPEGLATRQRMLADGWHFHTTNPPEAQ